MKGQRGHFNLEMPSKIALKEEPVKHKGDIVDETYDLDFSSVLCCRHFLISIPIATPIAVKQTGLGFRLKPWHVVILHTVSLVVSLVWLCPRKLAASEAIPSTAHGLVWARGHSQQTVCTQLTYFWR